MPTNVTTDAPLYSTVLSVLPVALLGAMLLLLPGLALLSWSVSARRLSPAARLALAPGVSLALGSLTVVWLSQVGLPVGPAVAWTFLALSGLAAVAGLRRLRQGWTAAAILAAFALVWFWQRTQLTQDLWAPPGVDSAHHALITRLIVEHRGLFSSWEPYDSASTCTYHIGFHAVAALLCQLSGADPLVGTLILSRLLIVSTCLGLFGLTQLWSRRVLAGLVAAGLFQGAFARMHFFEWYGRWTMLAGLTVLSAGFALLWLVATSRHRVVRLRAAIALAVTAGGLFVVHYKGALFFVVIGTVLAAGALWGLGPRRRRALTARRVRSILLAFLGAAVVSLGLAAPQLAPALRGRPGEQIRKAATVAASQRAIGYDTRRSSVAQLAGAMLLTPKKVIAMSLAAAGVLLALLRRNPALYFVLGWALMSLFVNPHWIGIDRLGPVDELHWVNALTTALAVMAGMAVGLGLDLLRAGGLMEKWARGAVLAGCVAVTFFGGHSEVMPFVSRDDRRAMEWLRREAKAGDRVVGAVNIADGVAHPVDALVWFPYFTGLRTNHTLYPLVLETGMKERRPRYEFSQALATRDLTARETVEWLAREGYAWVFVGTHAPRDHRLVRQAAGSPALTIAFQSGDAIVYRTAGAETLSIEARAR